MRRMCVVFILRINSVLPFISAKSSLQTLPFGLAMGVSLNKADINPTNWTLALQFNAFGKRQCVVSLDPKLSNRTVDLGVAKQQLHGPKVASFPISQRRFRSSHGMRRI